MAPRAGGHGNHHHRRAVRRNRRDDRRLPADAAGGHGLRHRAADDRGAREPGRRAGRAGARDPDTPPGCRVGRGRDRDAVRGRGRAAQVATEAGGANAVAAQRSAITPDFFATLGVAIRAGRPFSTADGPATRAAMINETLSRRLGITVGRRIWIGQDAYEVVGIAADYAINSAQARMSQPKVFLPLPAEARGPARLLFLIRARAIRYPWSRRCAARRARRPPAPSSPARIPSEIITVQGEEMLVGTAPMIPLIAIGTLLTAAGIYGVLAFALTRRSRELAVRMAIGAARATWSGWSPRTPSGWWSRDRRSGSASRSCCRGSCAPRAEPAACSTRRRHVFVWPVLAVVAIGAVATWVPSRRALQNHPAVLLRAS